MKISQVQARLDDSELERSQKENFVQESISGLKKGKKNFNILIFYNQT